MQKTLAHDLDMVPWIVCYVFIIVRAFEFLPQGYREEIPPGVEHSIQGLELVMIKPCDTGYLGPQVHPEGILFLADDRWVVQPRE